MKYMTEKDPAPALTRGIQILRLIQESGAMSLEQIALHTAWPKSSVLRCLQSLEQTGLVVRDPSSKRFSALMKLVPSTNDHQFLRESSQHILRALCQELNQTVELYAFENQELIMIDRLEPEDAVILIKAKIGFIRVFSEVDSLTQLVLSFGFPRSKWPKRSFWFWDKNKQQQSTTLKHVERLVQTARSEQVSADLGINLNGIHRFAAPILDSKNSLRGIIAIAQPFFPDTKKTQRHHLEILKEQTESIRLCDVYPIQNSKTA